MKTIQKAPAGAWTSQGLVGYLTTSFDNLTQLLGSPNGGGTAATTVEWHLLVGDHFCTIYDWRDSGSPTKNPRRAYCWHLGAHDRAGAKEFLETLRHAGLNPEGVR